MQGGGKIYFPPKLNRNKKNKMNIAGRRFNVIAVACAAAMATILFLMISSLVVVASPTQSERYAATVYFDGLSEYKLVQGVCDTEKGVACAIFLNEIFQNGWGKLNITSNPRFDDDVQMFASGYLEGFLTSNQIYDHAVNQYYVYGFPLDNIPTVISDFMSQNLKFMRSQVKIHRVRETMKKMKNEPIVPSDDINYWKQVGLVLNQMEGLVHGYNYELKDASKALTELQLFMLNAAGDMEDLVPALTENQFKTQKQRMMEEHDDTDEPLTDCSALVKFTGVDLFAGHTTWRSYGIIDKFYKVYNFGLHNVTSRKVSFSSSPGFLSSKDDFYIVQNSNLVVMETTNSIFNKTLYKALTPSSVLCWIRSIVTNQLANNGEQWTYYFAKYNSGSYNNQWMVIDYKLFVPGSISDNLLWIIEQIPGMTRSADVSSVLRKQGFWSSYNIPFFTDIYDISGYPEMKEKAGDDFDYINCPRAKIFNREQANVRDLDQFGRVLQFNQWQTDPFSLGLASMSISARYDLRVKKPVAFGGIDSKVTNVKLAKELISVGIAGPTHQDQTPFSWSSTDWNVPHRGQPDTWNFDWTTMANF